MPKGKRHPVVHAVLNGNASADPIAEPPSAFRNYLKKLRKTAIETMLAVNEKQEELKEAKKKYEAAVLSIMSAIDDSDQHRLPLEDE